jgi:hydrocephalus-inducing protein
VKGIGYVLHHTVGLQGAIVQVGAITNLDFGEIYINEKRVRQVTIENKGDFNFDFSVKRPPSLTSFLNVVPENGTVRRNDKFVVDFVFQPLS